MVGWDVTGTSVSLDGVIVIGGVSIYGSSVRAPENAKGRIFGTRVVSIDPVDGCMVGLCWGITGVGDSVLSFLKVPLADDDGG